jgi:predicted DNA-binding transcriptional regulator AlpA
VPAYAKIDTPELLTATALAALLGRRSTKSVYRLMRLDETFPRQIRLGSECNVAWRRADVMQWIAAQKPVQLTGLSGVELRQRAKQQVSA